MPTRARAGCGWRAGLQRLIADVESGGADFQVVLVYDVSRWGRFQDADESAYYEYVCKRAGIAVHYCAEQFANDGSPVSTIVKGVKRAMAGEYSRELSVKVFAGQCRLIELGYRQGGIAGYGLRRMRVDQHGQMLGLLRPGEQKSLQTDRVILVPGPADEIATVDRIYRLFVEDGKTEAQIAEILNRAGTATDLRRPWTRGSVHQVLSNEKYIGNNVYNRVSFKLKKRRVTNPPAMWVRADQAFEAVVEPPLFYAAQGIIRERTRQVTPQIRETRKYRAIRSSIAAVGVVEPLVVHPQPGGGYLRGPVLWCRSGKSMGESAIAQGTNGQGQIDPNCAVGFPTVKASVPARRTTSISRPTSRRWLSWSIRRSASRSVCRSKPTVPAFRRCRADRARPS